MTYRPVGPIDSRACFPPLYASLLELLRTFPPEAWNAPTACTSWTVKDVAAHMLDTDLRRLSIHRDGTPLLTPARPIASHADLVAFLDKINTEWVVAARRLSTTVLIDLIAHVGEQIIAYYASLDMHVPARFGVGWAGETTSATWFDVAREYTEKWVHQQHIRDAVDQPGMTERAALYPVLDTFLRALPYTYRAVDAPGETEVVVHISGSGGGTWSLIRQAGEWRLYYGAASQPATMITLDQDVAWRLLTKGISPEQGRRAATVQGDEMLATPFFGTVSILA
jgi:uncharacterized protein (TIGR03083 family)